MEDGTMPEKCPEKFTRHVEAVARRGVLADAGNTVDLGVSEESVRPWVRSSKPGALRFRSRGLHRTIRRRRDLGLRPSALGAS